MTAATVFTNAQVAPSLGRNLSSGPAGTVTVNVIQPYTTFLDRLTQLDLRLSKVFVSGHTRIQGNLDLYNALNAGTVLAANMTYGTTGALWQVPTQILQGRLVKLGIQMGF